jgi:acyl-CoA synthetase (AMP-forming)/AMP-acid ligase II
VISDEGAGAFGLKFPHLEYRIVDPDTGTPCADGVEGEICIRGYAVMLGLYGHERHECFDDDGWFHTGDRGSQRGPYLWFAGRIKDLIKSAGANVGPREVEAVLIEHPDVVTAIVLGVPDEQRGEVVGALIGARGRTHATSDELLALCRERLSPYKVPRVLLVTDPDDVPLLATGKPDLQAARSLLLEHGTRIAA